MDATYLAGRCPRCGATLASDAPDGLCPSCLLAAAAAPLTRGSVSTPDAPTVLG
jgi:NMD protein affecting ribosome stability and mRNA decay